MGALVEEYPPLTRVKDSRGRIRMRMKSGRRAFMFVGVFLDLFGYMLADGEGWFCWLVGKNSDIWFC